MPDFYRYTRPVAPRAARGQVAEIYAQLRRDLSSVADPIALHAPVPPLLAGAWAILRETLVAGQAPRGHREAVAAAVSTRNRCPWCADIHGMMLAASGYADVRNAIAAQCSTDIVDPQLRALVAWAEQPLLGPPPGDPALAPELVGTAVTFHYLNRMVNVLLVERFLPRTGLVRNTLTATLPLALRPLARRSVPPGESLRWLPHGSLPEDLAWAVATPTIACAFAGFATSVEEQGQLALTPLVRALVHERLASWDGEALGLSRGWVEQAVAGLAEADAATARLALLAALASYQIDDGLVADFRRHYPDDATLVVALAWASFAAARQIGCGALAEATCTIR